VLLADGEKIQAQNLEIFDDPILNKKGKKLLFFKEKPNEV
jgi:hypothetical protein